FDPTAPTSRRTAREAPDTAPPFAKRDRSAKLAAPERVASGAAGALLLAWGAGRDGLLAKLALLGGAGLLARAGTGRCALKCALQPKPYEREVAEERNWPIATVVNYAVTINRPREEIYRFWRDFANLPRFMQHVEQVETITPQRSRWTVKAPLGRSVQWISYVMEDVENERIAWEAEAQADIPNAGWVEFRDAPGGRGTEVRAQISYQPPYGHAGRLVSQLKTAETPNNQLADDLRRLKQVLETGDATTSQTRTQA
ncbi:SRPBCC family protein, partial [Bordetella sp. 02P26C-1]|uniref:SRPBCC family protein n=2 Tax=unclassified Bordetella TaxID=2630031 RepID=UPI001355BA59